MTHVVVLIPTQISHWLENKRRKNNYRIYWFLHLGLIREGNVQVTSRKNDVGNIDLKILLAEVRAAKKGEK